MYELRSDGQITLPQGDTLLFKMNLTGEVFPEGSMAVFGICNTKGASIFRKQFPVQDNTIIIWLANADTRTLPVGKYRWDVRIVTDPEYGEDGVVRCEDESDNVISIFSGSGMPTFEVTEVAADV